MFAKFISTLSRATVSLILVIFVVTAGVSGYGTAQTSDDASGDQEEWLKAKQLADQAFDSVEKKRFTEARQLVMTLSDELLHLRLGDYVKHVEQADMILETVAQAKNTLTQVELDERRVYRDVLRLRLVIDAVLNKEQGLWIKYYPELVKVVTAMEQSIDQNERDQFYRQLNQLYNHYEFIRPALVVVHSPQMISKLDSLITYLDKKSARLWQERDITLNVLNQLHHQLNVAFFQKEDSFSENLVWLTMGVALVIATVLTYVGWRKYKGEYMEQPLLGRRERLRD